jgi:hypothetical protein
MAAMRSAAVARLATGLVALLRTLPPLEGMPSPLNNPSGFYKSFFGIAGTSLSSTQKVLPPPGVSSTQMWPIISSRSQAQWRHAFSLQSS